MTGLETAAIITALAFMGVIMLTFIVVLFVILSINKKVGRLIASTQSKIDGLEKLPMIGKRFFKIARHML